MFIIRSRFSSPPRTPMAYSSTPPLSLFSSSTLSSCYSCLFTLLVMVCRGLSSDNCFLFRQSFVIM